MPPVDSLLLFLGAAILFAVVPGGREERLHLGKRRRGIRGTGSLWWWAVDEMR